MVKLLDIRLERDELHSKLGGGLPENSITLIEGPDGGGKSVLSQRFAYALLEHGHSVTYISTEMNTVDFVKQMASLEYNIISYMLDEKLLFIPMFPFFGYVEFDENFMNKLIKDSYIYKNDIIVFDTFSYLIVKDATRKTNIELVDFFKRLLGMGKTLIITINKDMISEELFKILKSISDVYLHVELRERYGVLVNFIDVIRFKMAGDTIDKQVPFRVEPGVGISIEITA